jgi:hypothetical protein
MAKTSMAMATAWVAVALGAAGCGGSKSPSQTTSSTNTSAARTATGPALTKAQLIAKADPICARLTAERLSHKIRSREDYLRVSAELEGSEHQALEEMQKLSPPASVASTWNQMLAGYKEISEDVAKVGQAAAANETAQLRPLIGNATALEAHVATLARSAGFKDCGQSI